MAGSREPKHETYAYLWELPIEKLLKLLDLAPVPATCPEDEAYVDALEEAILEKEKQHPTGFLPDPDLQWAEFQTYFDVTEESLIPEWESEVEEALSAQKEGDSSKNTSRCQVRGRRVWRTVLTAVAVAVCMLGCMIAAQAAGFDVFGALGRWSENTFSFIIGTGEDSDSGAVVSVSPEYADFYEDMQTLVEEMGVQQAVTPTWYPSGFEASSLEVFHNDVNDAIVAMFQHEDGQSFTICITQNKSDSYLDTHIFEKDSSLVEQYTDGGKMFYIFSNLNSITATWAENTLIETISGDLTVDEAKMIISSIGGE